VFLTALFEALLDNVRTLLLATEFVDVALHHGHHLVAPLGLSELENVLDDLVALLVLSQSGDVGHDLALEAAVEIVCRHALDDLLDHSAA